VFIVLTLFRSLLTATLFMR